MVRFTIPVLMVPALMLCALALPVAAEEGVQGLEDPADQAQVQEQLRRNSEALERLKQRNEAAQEYARELDRGVPPGLATHEYRQKLNGLNQGTIGGQPLFLKSQIPGQ
ncbi:hypothetical protein [Pseudooceanicola sp. HF7]|uniref:hypothetical protein n=1 Tax=Pseudooceanicola sp. HF7 TaxID=2721560 RepID=UPI00142FE215|nr:hypothetical protein [Pseudooceanicola sp. HF7]NIZ09585.1 hypothetical protein [Pseudooceanicola sp. HF7]